MSILSILWRAAVGLYKSILVTLTDYLQHDLFNHVNLHTVFNVGTLKSLYCFLYNRKSFSRALTLHSPYSIHRIVLHCSLKVTQIPVFEYFLRTIQDFCIPILDNEILYVKQNSHYFLIMVGAVIRIYIGSRFNNAIIIFIVIYVKHIEPSRSAQHYLT